MTGRDPLAVWPGNSYALGANDRLDALRPLITAATELAAALLGPQPLRQQIDDLAMQVRDLTTPKGDTP